MVDQVLSPVVGVETVPDGEAAQIQEIADLMVKLLEQRYGDGKPFLRGVHPKSHGCARATFTVHADLPKHLRVGVFATPGVSYDAVVRFSNAAALVGPDVQELVTDGVKSRLHGSRGMAIKVRGLPATSYYGDEPDTQDFLMVNFPVFPFANVADYLVLTRAQLEHKDEGRLVFKTFAEELTKSGGGLRAKAAGEISAAIQQIPLIDPLASRYFSAASFMFGPDRVMKFGVKPTSNVPETPLADVLDENYLRLALGKRLREMEATFDFGVQVRVPSEDAHIEDVTKSWDEASEPFQSVATISIPQQEVDGTDEISRCESLFFTPWHTLPEHRPVGGINRLRLAAYQASVNRRRK
jgi:hypothetical protein